jgi:anti-sigma regulatory factor (Ser/Thr protein kinase)
VVNDRVETQVPSHDTTPLLARAFLRTALQSWKLDGLGDVTELLADELVSNVVRHVGRPMTLRAIVDDGSLRVEVDDPSTQLPRVRHPDPDESRGRGMLMVDALATDWGTEVRDSGKTVWFQIDAGTASAEVHKHP